MSWDNDFVVFRRFKRLNYFNLLRLQQRLRELDDNLSQQLIGEDSAEMDRLTLQIRDTLQQYST
jgi:hypothetical protein